MILQVGDGSNQWSNWDLSTGKFNHQPRQSSKGGSTLGTTCLEAQQQKNRARAQVGGGASKMEEVYMFLPEKRRFHPIFP